MQVFKFGGSSIKDANAIKNIFKIISNHQDKPLLIIVSALGKTTNALENVVNAFFDKKQTEALELFNIIKINHIVIAKELDIDSEYLLADITTEAEWMMHDNPVRNYDYYYDQIVCLGELMSSTIVHAYLQKHLSKKIIWQDIRDIVRTDAVFRDAAIDKAFTLQKVNEIFLPILNNDCIIISQGFIGATDDNESTTLGREGSDYSAALLSNMLNANNLTIWKDVEGIMNADPKKYPDAVVINNLHYEELIEMSYYGAQVVHPKTIQPLFEKNIPLHVKCFIDSNLPGSIVDNKLHNKLPAIYIDKPNQVLISFTKKDLNFIGETGVGYILDKMKTKHINSNLTQIGAISFYACMDDRGERINELVSECLNEFEIQVTKGLTLHTIRHFEDKKIEDILIKKDIILLQKTKGTIQFLLVLDSK